MYRGSKNFISDQIELETIIEKLHRIQHELFNTETILATLPEDISSTHPELKKKIFYN